MSKKQKMQEFKQLTDLPQEIIEEILKRLRVQSLLRFSCTAKRWHSLIFSDPKFNRAHIDHFKRPSWKIPVIRSSSNIVRAIDCDCNITKIRPEETLTIYLRDPILLGSCNGLLFVVGKNIYESKEHGLWNPYTNLFKRIDGKIDGGCCYSMSGLSYDRASDDYKAIVVLNESGNRSPYVFSLRRNSWKKLSDLSTVDITGRINVPCGITLDNGICHWETELASPGFFSVIWFDPVEEKFKEIPLPDKVRSCPTGRPFGIGALDGCLSLIHENSVWVMKGYKCWTKLYVLGLSTRLNCTYKLVGYNSSKDKVLVIARAETFQRFRVVDVGNGEVSLPSDNQIRSFADTFNVLPYTESLLCPWLCR